MLRGGFSAAAFSGEARSVAPKVGLLEALWKAGDVVPECRSRH